MPSWAIVKPGTPGSASARDGLGQRRARQRPVGRDAVVLGLSLAAEERDLSGFVGHALDSTPKQGRICPLMAKTDRVLALLEALQDRPSATGPGARARRLGVDVRTLRRDIVALRDLGIPVEGERGRGGSYRLRPGYRVPPLMFTTGEAAAVALGLMAARRLGTRGRRRAGQGPPRPARPRAAAGRVARAHARLHRRARRRAARRRDAARARRRRPPQAPRPGPLHRLGGRRDAPASSARTASSPTAGRWYVPAYDHPRDDLRALRADRFGTVRVAGRGRAAAGGLRRDRLRQPRASPASPGRTRSRSSSTPTPPPPPAASHPRSPNSSPHGDAHAPAPARRLARLGRRPARRRRLRLHRPPPRSPPSGPPPPRHAPNAA